MSEQNTKKLLHHPGPSGDYLSDFKEDQWWVVELDALVINGTPDQKRAMAVVRNMLKTIEVNLNSSDSVQEPDGDVTDEENEQFSRDVSNFKGADPEATAYALEQFLKNRKAAAQPVHVLESDKQIGVHEHRCPEVTGHRGPSFVCQKAGHGVSQDIYCNDCNCPEAQKERNARTALVLDHSPTTGMNIAQRILHVGGRNNAAGYVEFGSIQAVEALVRHVLRDLPVQSKT